jgi:hypothetical protein
VATVNADDLLLDVIPVNVLAIYFHYGMLTLIRYPGNASDDVRKTRWPLRMWLPTNLARKLDYTGTSDSVEVVLPDQFSVQKARERDRRVFSSRSGLWAWVP